MHDELVRGPVTQVLRKGDLIHGEAYTQMGGYSQRNTVSHKFLLLSQPLTVHCLFKKCTVKVSSKRLFLKSPEWSSVLDSLLEKSVKISGKCIL